MQKKKNIFVRFFKLIGRGIRNFFLLILFGIAYLILFPFFKAKVKGKKNINKDDEARVFLCNHYEVYGPISMYMSFHLKFKPWVIDKMMNEEDIEKQISLMIMNENNFKWASVKFKKFAIKSLKNFAVFVLKLVGGIAVSRENPRANIETLQKSTKALNKDYSLVIFPEYRYVTEGVGDFQTGFEHIGKYYYQKTGKKIAFYPVFISKELKTINVLSPITFNPEEDVNANKQKIVSYLKDQMVNCYNEVEVNNTKLQEKIKKRKAKSEKKEAKKLASKDKSKSISNNDKK